MVEERPQDHGLSTRVVSSVSKHCHHTLPRDSQSVEAMKLLAILTFYITVYESLCVAGTKCRGVKCTILAETQQNNMDNGKATDLDQSDKYSCCACGGATYHITFIGKWTRATYPRHFPGIMARWSSLIGASHSKDYILWKYGGMASPGVTRVSEWGSVDKLVQEMKHQGDDLFSIIKTQPLYKSDGQVSASFKADTQRNLVSALSKMYPSPDWNVGVDRVNLCDGNCTWKKQITMDLFPWDAGTDDGITFISANRKSKPQQPIRNITRYTHQHSQGSFPNTEESDNIQPFGQVKLRLMHTSGSCQKRKQPHFVRGERTHCEVSRWSSWTRCSVACGQGQQTRGRAVIKTPTNDGIRCGNLSEHRPCIGSNCTVPSVKENCKVSAWSGWSECRGTCSRGGRFRTRRILQKAGPGGKPCPDFNSLIKWRRCKLPKCSADKSNDCIVTGWSPWTSCSKKCNRGKKFRVRKIIKSEKKDGVSCPTKLKDRTRCRMQPCPTS